MLEFKKLTYRSLSDFVGSFEQCNYRISGFSPVGKLMWEKFYHAEYTVNCGCLIYKNRIFGKTFFNYPMPIEDSYDEERALQEIENYCVEKYIPLVFFDVPVEKISALANRYRFMKLNESRNYEDYLYKAEDFRTFSGKRFSGQRNHINKFRSLYPAAEFRFFTDRDKAELDRFFDEFIFKSDTDDKKKETEYARKLINKLPLKKHLIAGYVLDGKIISVTLGTRMGDTLFIHIEKGLREYEGIYTATANAFATAVRDAEFISREDDSGVKGLRISKTQYHPYKMVRKFLIYVQNEWERVEKFPTIKTERLILDSIKKEDAKAYYDICTDDDRNKYWGYDYKKDLKGDLYTDYFYNVQKHDLKNKMCFCFAVRLDGKMIGEGVLYRFTGSGKCEAGMRISKDYAGLGYGKEAFYAMTDWALYVLGLDEVVSKCYHENKASYNMLSAGMKITGKDDTFVYFSRKV